MSTVALVAGVAAVLGVPAAASAATTLEVGSGRPYATIQSAINAARNGDTVSVSPGNYVENITIDKYITVKGADRVNTRITSSGIARAVVAITNVPYLSGGRTVLSNFTITGGNAPSGQGGGVTVALNASPEISHNVIDGNRAQAYGGGIAVHTNSSPLILDNIIRNNTAFSGGAGIFVANNSSPMIYGNTINNNSTAGVTITNGGASGGGIYLENTGDANARSTPVVLNNTISANQAEFAGGGIMVRTGAAAIIEGNTINGNAAAYGGGIHMETTGAYSRIERNNITSNRASANAKYAGSGVGGGIALFDKSSTLIGSNTISNNQASVYGGGVSSAEGASTTLTGNVINGNSTSYSSTGSQDGGGLYVANSTMIATNNQFFDNGAAHGGAIALSQAAVSTISNNTITRNASGSTAGGGAVFVEDNSSSTLIANNILTQNDGFQLLDPRAKATVNNNLLTSPRNPGSGGELGLYFDYNVGSTSTAAALNALAKADNNVDTAAGLTNPGGNDFTLTAGSTARDRGTTSGIPATATDYRGALRQTGVIDIGAFEYEAAPIVPEHVYRFFSSSKKGHFFTLGPAERNVVASSYVPSEWQYESVAYDAFASQVAGTIPLYRFYSEQFQGHFYTANAEERDYVDNSFPDNVWHYEYVAYYVYPTTTTAPSRNVYRFWSADNKHHFYTASEAESIFVRNNYPKNVWDYEGPNFKVPIS